MANGEVFDLVAGDVENGLGTMFGPDPPEGERPVIVHPEFEGEHPIGNDEIAAVPWIYRCKHDGDFLRLFPTARHLEIHGTTFVDNRRGETLMWRYVDWLGVIN